MGIDALCKIADVMTDKPLEGVFVHVVFFAHGNEMLATIVGLMFRVQIETDDGCMIAIPKTLIANLTYFSFGKI